MKKIYSFALAAGFSALACTAANPNPVSPVQPQFGIQTLDAKIGGNVAVAQKNANGMMKAAANNNAPATLEGLDLCFSWDYILDNQAHPNSQALELKLTKSEEGIQYYTSTGFLKGVLIDEVTVNPMEILYEPASGTLMIPSGQTLCVYQGKDFIIWNYRDDQFLYKDMNFYFEYKNDTFEWINPFEITEENGQKNSFNSIGLIIGNQSSTGVQAMVHADNLSFRVAQGTMTYTADLVDQQTKQTIPTTVEGPLFASVEKGQLVVENFGSPTIEFLVPFNVDTTNKTISCENVRVLNEGGVPWYLSQGEDLFNKYESEGTYKVVAPYTVANGKTTVDVGEWNAYAYDAATSEDLNYFVKFYNTKMVFNFDLNALFASVGNVAVDDANAPVEYYNLQGVRVQNPENGLYIRRQGKNVTKVIL